MTIKDIARIAGVSVSTVSRVINYGNVRVKTKRKVLKVMEKHDFYPDTYAQYLGRKNNPKPPIELEPLPRIFIRRP